MTQTKDSHTHKYVEILRDLKPSILDGHKKGKIIMQCECGRMRCIIVTRHGYSIKEF